MKKTRLKLIFMIKKLSILGIFIIAFAGGYFLHRHFKYYKESVPQAVEISEVTKKNVVGKVEEVAVKGEEIIAETGNKKSKIETVEENIKKIIPEELNLDVAFYPQAPFANWDYPWQEACEEASVLLAVNEYYDHNWTREEFNEEILKLVEWEKKTFGSYEHTSVEQTAQILNDYFDLKTKIHAEPSLEDVQEILANGNLIVMTFAGKELKNPNYKNGGPIYHAMLIKGYKKGEKIITHDVGTRNGENYVYTWKGIYDSLHDYAEPIQDGAKLMIEVFPPEVENF